MPIEILRQWQDDGEIDVANLSIKLKHGNHIVHLCMGIDDDVWLAVITPDMDGEPGAPELSEDLFLEAGAYVPRSKLKEGQVLAMKLSEEWLEKNYKGKE